MDNRLLAQHPIFLVLLTIHLEIPLTKFLMVTRPGNFSITFLAWVLGYCKEFFQIVTGRIAANL